MSEELKELRVLLDAQGIVAEDASMLSVFQNALYLASMDTTVLLHGESGVGKDRVAKFIHANGPRRDRPFIHVNCSAIPQALFESELFGYEPGTFTGGLHSGKRGLLEAANGGVLFLDEIGEMSLANQVKLLDFLQNRQIIKVGGRGRQELDVRIISATNRDLRKEVRAGRFREDFFFRICVVTLEIPPLRERPQDVKAFAARFIQSAIGLGTAPELTPEALIYLQEQPWPGNVRELQNLMERVCIFEEGHNLTRDVLAANHLSAPMRRTSDSRIEVTKKPLTLREAVDRYKRDYILHVIEETTTLEDAAHLLGISLDLLYREKRRLGIYKRWHR